MSKKQNNKASNGNVNKNTLMIIGVALIAAAALFIVFNPKDTPSQNLSDTNLPIGGNLTITKSDITEEVSFYPYNSNNTYMEVLAIRATDGSVRTALNTCQVCYRSGRGYYEQKGDALVCRNCGNRFTVNEIELVKGGCNPVPITSDLKTENEEEIVITADALAQFETLFSRWSK